ncbi:TonB-dependent receptor [Aliamphritea hakodatensis]|uniref:TonB-dependent receptor n=1 Tax=Aliamphritea hakodatensis TaxID=2895352 RepID=UPI0022FD8AAC|nr:TonB-dependent siderophore receptor [Aliamphritea hakodatensis]
MSESKIKHPIQRLRNKATWRSNNSLALAISGALLATPAVAEETSIPLETLEVEESLSPDTNPYAVPGSPYLAERLSDPRRTRPLAETPSTITVLTATEIKDTGRSDLKDVLDAQPGITLGTGENGNAFGDRYIIRGYESQSDVFIDGLRDPGMTIRESFAVEQVEISKGPSSTFAGRGTTGGAVNSATKRASTEYDFSNLSTGIGTDGHHRLTLDTNQVLNYDTAIRANLLHAEEEVPDRAPADRKRRGLALSLSHAPTDQLEITADYYHFKGKDSPDLGTYFDNETNKPVKNIPAYVQDEDFLKSEVNTGTLRIGYEISPAARIVNLSRYGKANNGYLASGARSTTALPHWSNPGWWTSPRYPSALLTDHNGWQEVEHFANQFNLITDQELFGLNHELVFSLEYSDQSVLNGEYNYQRTGEENCSAFQTSTRVGIDRCIIDKNGNAVTGLNSLLKRTVEKDDWDSDWNIKTTSLAVMDTVDLTDRWTVFSGLRYDYYNYKNTIKNGGIETDYTDKSGFWNGHLGAGYDLTDSANVYASWSTSTNLNGGESDLGANCGYGGLCVDPSRPGDLGDPEKTQSFELGTKWRFNDNKLLATAALFRTTKDDVMENPSGDSYSRLGSLNTGKNRVEGLELGVSGNLTPRLSVQAGVAIMESEVLKSVTPDSVGGTLANFADKSASLHLRYQATQKFAFGGTATYESKRFVGQPDSAANEDLGIPSYTVFDAFASYKPSRDMTFRLNVGNVFDKDYYLAGYRSGSFVYIGDKRNIQLTMDYQF